MSKAKRIKIAIFILIAIVVLNLLVIYMEPTLDILEASQENKIVEEYRETYGQSKADWDLLIEKGITPENAQSMEKLMYDHIDVVFILDDTVEKIKNGTYTEEDNPVTKFRKELGYSNSTPDVIVADKFQHVNGIWEVNDSFFAEHNEKYGHFYVEITMNEAGSELITMVVYNNQDEEPVRNVVLDLEGTWDENFSMKIKETGDTVIIEEIDNNTLQMFVNSTYYDLTRATEGELDGYIQ